MSVSTRSLALLIAGSMLATSTAATAGQVVRPAASPMPSLAQAIGQAELSAQAPCLVPGAAISAPVATSTSAAVPANCVLAAVDAASISQATTIAAAASAQPDTVPPGTGGIGVLPIVLGLVGVVVLAALIFGGGGNSKGNLTPVSPA